MLKIHDSVKTDGKLNTKMSGKYQVRVKHDKHTVEKLFPLSPSTASQFIEGAQ